MRLVKGGRAAVRAMAAAAALVGGGATYALAAGGSATLSACVHSRGGALYEAKKCARHDRRLTWNMAGPQGVTGPAGAAGKNGTNGTNGSNGTNGIGATAYPVSVPYGTDGQEIAPLAQSSSIYITCNAGTGSDFLLLGVNSTSGWQALGSYTAYELGGTQVGNRHLDGSTADAQYSYPIAADSGSFLYEVQSTATPADAYGYYSGTADIAISSGTATSHDQVDFNLFSVPGSGCQGEVTVYPA